MVVPLSAPHDFFHLVGVDPVREADPVLVEKRFEAGLPRECEGCGVQRGLTVMSEVDGGLQAGRQQRAAVETEA